MLQQAPRPPRAFTPPDFRASIDFAARIAATPASAQAKGMFFQFLLDSLDPRLVARLEPPRYVAFKSYPLREYMDLLARACRIVYPASPSSEALRRLGRHVYPHYARTMTGTAVFAIAGRSFRRIVELCPKAYQIGMTPGRVNVVESREGYALVELREIYNFPELHQVGVWEGAMDVCNVRGSIQTHVISAGSVDFEVRWSA